MWKEIDKDFRRLVEICQAYSWIGICNSDPDNLVLTGCPELWNWYDQYKTKFKALTKEQAEAL